GYSELRRLFDYLLSEGLIGSPVADRPREDLSDRTGWRDSVGRGAICVVDAEDLLDRPQAVISAYCEVTGIPYDPNMLHWDKPRDQERAATIINRWGFDIYFHTAALESKTLHRDTQVSSSPVGTDSTLNLPLF